MSDKHPKEAYRIRRRAFPCHGEGPQGQTLRKLAAVEHCNPPCPVEICAEMDRAGLCLRNKETTP